MRPAIIFDYMEVEKWEKWSADHLYAEMSNLEKQLCKNINAFYCNVDFYIANICGKVCITVLFSSSCISLWNYENGISIGDFPKLEAKEIRDIIKKVSAHKTKCNDCGEWIDNHKIINYSFAGGVCKKCYDPKKHLPPDTSGT